MKQSTLMALANKPDPVVVSGKGHYLTDDKGLKYLDFVQGWAVNCLGHSPSQLVKVIAEQAATLLHAGPGYHNQASFLAAQTLSQLSGLGKVTFANSGAEANECAIKLARKWGSPQGKYKIITFEGCFHGRTLATMSASGKASFDLLYNPKVPGFMRVPWQDLDAVKRVADEQVCAVMLELVQGEGGVNRASLGFVQQLAQWAKNQGILLIVDEVQTGIGRTGKMFCFQHYNVVPDIVTLGKGLGGGMPVSAVMCQPQYACFEPGDQGGTFNGAPLAMAVVTEVVNTVSSSRFLADVTAVSLYLNASLAKLGEVRGEGLLLALAVPSGNADEIVAAAMGKGLLLNAPNRHCIRFMPALTLSCDEVDEMMQILEPVWRQLTA